MASKCTWIYRAGKAKGERCLSNTSVLDSTDKFCCKHVKSGRLNPPRPEELKQKDVKPFRELPKERVFKEEEESGESDIEEVGEGDEGTEIEVGESLEEVEEKEDEFSELEPSTVKFDMDKKKKTPEEKKFEKDYSKKKQDEEKKSSGWNYGKKGKVEVKSESEEEEEEPQEFHDMDNIEGEEEGIDESEYEDGSFREVLDDIKTNLHDICKVKTLAAMKKLILELCDTIDTELASNALAR